MEIIEGIYLLGITFGMCVLYTATSFFLAKSFIKVSKKSLLTIFFLSCFFYFISYFVIKDEILGNRFLHAFGGGFMAFFTTLLVLKDNKVVLSKRLLLILGFAIVLTFGLLNEVIELFLQNHTSYLFAQSREDTLLDLTSNTIGFLILFVMVTLYPGDQKRIAVPQSR